METYGTIDEALTVLLHDWGTDVLCDIARFIALLSDYAPNHEEAQREVRVFVRTGGVESLGEGIREELPPSRLMGLICECAARSEIEHDRKMAIVETTWNALKTTRGKYGESLDPNDLHIEALSYYRRLPREENVPTALLLFQQADKAGSSISAYFIAASYLKGKGVEQDVDTGMRYLELAAKKNDVKAKRELADRLWHGLDTDKDSARAVAILKGMGDPESLYMLAEIYRENIEYEHAFKYYLNAAREGHVYAQYAAALAFATGQGVGRDMNAAKKWLREAAEHGHGEARRKLDELGDRSK